MNFDTEKQKLLLEYLISSPDTFTLCRGIIKPEYFNIELKNAVHFVLSHFDKYNSLPDAKIIKAETKVQLNLHDAGPNEINYCAKEIETFCRYSGMKNAVFKSADMIDKGEFDGVSDLVKEALMISLTKDLGLRYFDDPKSRLERMLNGKGVEPTGWSEFDEAMYGGIGRKELILFSASSGGGKSITLANLGLNFLETKRNVLYVTLELDPDIVAQRFDTMITGISKKTWKDHVGEISEGVRLAGKNHGTLDIVYMPSHSKPAHLNSFLKEFFLFHNTVPDLVLLDYMDLMDPNSGSHDNVWDKDKQVAEEVRNIAAEWNFPIASATQLNRSAVGQEKHTHAMIAGGISKINTCDTWVTISLDDVRKQKGEIVLHFNKTRNSDAVGSSLVMKWDPRKLRITDKDAAPRLELKKKTPEKKSILDLMTS